MCALFCCLFVCVLKCTNPASMDKYVLRNLILNMTLTGQLPLEWALGLILPVKKGYNSEGLSTHRNTEFQ